MVYGTFVFLLGLIAVNRDYQPPAEGISVFVSTNGRHTYFVLPARSEHIDWMKYFPPHHFEAVDSNFQYVSFGWGDRAYYTQTEGWDDLNISVALKAALLPTSSAMHVEYMPFRPSPGPYYCPLTLTAKEYHTLCKYILASFEWDGQNQPYTIEEAVRYSADMFYEATGYYHMFYTSNNWTNEGLKAINVRTVLWSPLDEPLMRQLRKIDD